MLDRVLSRDRVSFFGNVEVGRDVQSRRTDVALRCGRAGNRRRARSPPRTFRARNFPASSARAHLPAGTTAIRTASRPQSTVCDRQSIIGNGNVAIDVARVLAKSADRVGRLRSVTRSDVVAGNAADRDHSHRRPAQCCRCEVHPARTRRTGHFAARAARHGADPTALAGDGAVVETLRSFAANQSRTASVTIYFHFNLTPIAFLGDGRLRAVQFRSADGATQRNSRATRRHLHRIRDASPAALPLLPTAYSPTKKEKSKTGCTWSDGQSEALREPFRPIAPKLSRWRRRSRKKCRTVHDRGERRLRQLLEQRHVCWVDYAAWRRIDAAELARACDGRCREKFSTVTEMLEAAQVGQSFGCPSATT